MILERMAPEVGFLLARSLRTLALRVKAHNATGAFIAERNARHPRVKQANYPGLATFAGYEIANLEDAEHLWADLEGALGGSP